MIDLFNHTIENKGLFGSMPEDDDLRSMDNKGNNSKKAHAEKKIENH